MNNPNNKYLRACIYEIPLECSSKIDSNTSLTCEYCDICNKSTISVVRERLKEALTFTRISGDSFHLNSGRLTHKGISCYDSKLITNRELHRPSWRIKVESIQLGTSLDIPQLCSLIGTSRNKTHGIPCNHLRLRSASTSEINRMKSIQTQKKKVSSFMTVQVLSHQLVFFFFGEKKDGAKATPRTPEFSFNHWSSTIIIYNLQNTFVNSELQRDIVQKYYRSASDNNRLLPTELQMTPGSQQN